MVPPLTVDAGPVRPPDAPVLCRFGALPLPDAFKYLLTPFPERIFTLTGRALQRTARERPGSWFEPSLVARRHEHHARLAATVVDCTPPHWQRAAGVIRQTVCRGEHASFPGAFVRRLAHDLTGQGWRAEFASFKDAPQTLGGLRLATPPPSGLTLHICANA